MNKSEAINAMQHGKVVTHRFFTDNEYIHMKEGYIVTEEGYKCAPSLFWGDRTDDNWNEDWEIKELALKDPVYYPKTTHDMTEVHIVDHLNYIPDSPTQSAKAKKFGDNVSWKVASVYGSLVKFK